MSSDDVEAPPAEPNGSLGNVAPESEPKAAPAGMGPLVGMPPAGMGPLVGMPPAGMGPPAALGPSVAPGPPAAPGPSAAVAPPDPPLLSASAVRIAVDDVVSIDAFHLTTTGDRVLFVGDASVLFAAISGVPLLSTAPPSVSQERARDEMAGPLGEARIVAGQLLINGLDVASHAHIAAIGFAPLDPPVPLDMTALVYVTWAARLTGLGRASRHLAEGALARVGLERVANRPAASLPIPERRALQLAKAIVAAPPVLVAEAPLDRLSDAAAGFVMNALFAANQGRRLLVSARRIQPDAAEGALARAASDVIFWGDGRVLASGLPAGALPDGNRAYRLIVTQNGEALAAAMRRRGLRPSFGPTHLTVALPQGTTTALVLEAASEARAPIVEMVPLLDSA